MQIPPLRKSNQFKLSLLSERDAFRRLHHLSSSSYHGYLSLTTLQIWDGQRATILQVAAYVMLGNTA